MQHFIFTLAAAEQGGPAGWQQLIGSFFPFILLFVVLYMLWIRPEQKRAKAHRELIQHLKTGDRVVISGGIHGTVSAVTEKTLKIKIADKVDIEVERAAVGRVVQNKTEEKGK